MAGDDLTLFCMSMTPFDAQGRLDEDALQQHLQRLVGAGLGVYLGSGGAGEGHALSRDELKRVYEIGAGVCKGRAPVYANPPEQRTATAMLELAQMAAASGIDVVQIYAVDAGHGMRPNPEEQEAYYRFILDRFSYPAALTVHPAVGYLPTVRLLQQLCEDYPQIAAINVMTAVPQLLIQLQDAVRPGVAFYTRMMDMASGLALGAQGAIAAEPNIAPRLSRSILAAFAAGERSQFRDRFAQFVRLSATLERWGPGPRWAKMAAKILGLPGGNGVVRPPYLMPPASEFEAMAAALERLGIDEVRRRA